MVTKLFLTEEEYAQVVEAMENSLVEDGWDGEEFDDLVLSCAKAVDAALAVMDIETVLDDGEDEYEDEDEDEEEDESYTFSVYDKDGTRVINFEDATRVLDMISDTIEADEETDPDDYIDILWNTFFKFCEENGIEAVDIGEQGE